MTGRPASADANSTHPGDIHECHSSHHFSNQTLSCRAHQARALHPLTDGVKLYCRKAVKPCTSGVPKTISDFGIITSTPLRDDETELVQFIVSGFINLKLAGELYVDINARISFTYYPGEFANPPDIDINIDGGRPICTSIRLGLMRNRVAGQL